MRRVLIMGAFRKYLADKCITFLGDDTQSLTITQSGVTRVFEYSYDKDVWVKYKSGAIQFVDGHLYLRGDNPSGLSTSTSKKVKFSFGNETEVYCSGNIMHLIGHMEDPVSIPCNYCFYQLFQNCTQLRSAPELPSKKLTSYCYAYMFNGCTSLDSAPELPSLILSSNCYSNMFNGCTNLNYIKALFTPTPGTSYTSNWVKGVATSGTFVKNKNATWNVNGVNGVPSGWTIVKE